MKNDHKLKNKNDLINHVNMTKKIQNRNKVLEGREEKLSNISNNFEKYYESEETINYFKFYLNEQQQKICQILKFEKPTEIQELVIEYLFTKEKRNDNDKRQENIILKNRAGTGKTFAFIISILKNFDYNCNKLQVIIILPTRELALQTSEYFETLNNYKNSENISEFNFKYQVLIGGHPDINEKKSKLLEKNNKMINKDTQILIGTIGKLIGVFKDKKNSKRNLDLLFNLKTIVLDEADKLIYQNKKNLLSNFLTRISDINEDKGPKKFLNEESKFDILYTLKINYILVSASLDSGTINFYSQVLKTDFEILEPIINNIPRMNKFLIEKSQSYLDENKFLKKEKLVQNKNENISLNINEYYYVFKHEERTTYFENKYMKLLFILNSLKDNFKQALIFYNQKVKGEELAADLRDQGWQATAFIHGDLSQDQRLLIYKKIKNMQIKLILSTDLVKKYSAILKLKIDI